MQQQRQLCWVSGGGVHAIRFESPSLRILGRSWVFGASSLVESLVKVFPNQKSQFELLKMHLTAHMAPTIKARGTPKEYSSNLYEHKHKTMVKQPARNTNCRDVGCDIAFRQECLAAVKQIAREEAVDPQCETAMRLVSMVPFGLGGM
ncbi:hypothetical protein CLOM_g7308 [Closterium sp. NIES-68]|nr:hypothetical protein CLOM_g7308 [Closterium sp. NIES-68]GJP62599.1 hypothetical protein CLOP_g19641 [Closterium sp. NIES-67]